ncbi:MAG: putative inorganic polyphosphate/ATP-NAD kinase [Candidatus Heimdallarchaeota archaeon LC_3]|nr:MAG: putative inorganic polyphosphate/ATP-NAD kinase [Candidatus Heimdallarchaeota archaeon LC_3]
MVKRKNAKKKLKRYALTKGICVSAKSLEEFRTVEKMILKEAPDLNVIPFENILKQPNLLDQCDFILTVGGDGSVAWLVGTFYKLFESVSNLKPIIPTIRPESVGYLKQLSLDPEEEFRKGFKQIIDGNYSIQHRTILKTNVLGNNLIGVNEILLHCEPHLGKFKVSIENRQTSSANKREEILTETMADGVMISTSIGSTAWSLSYNGQISLNEDSLQLVFIAGIHSTANFILPKEKIRLNLELKNPVITKETIGAYNQFREKFKLPKDKNPSKTLEIVYGPRVVIDGKVQAFGVKELEIDPSLSIPFMVLNESVVDKARKLTKMQGN